MLLMLLLRSREFVGGIQALLLLGPALGDGQFNAVIPSSVTPTLIASVRCVE